MEKRLALDPNPVHILVGASESGTSLKIQDSRAPQTRARCLSPMAHRALLSTARRPALRQNCRKLFARAKRRAEKRDVGAASQVDARHEDSATSHYLWMPKTSPRAAFDSLSTGPVKVRPRDGIAQDLRAAAAGVWHICR